ncbi:hypothetical protein JCM15765_38960 [Paradesulfitobacterium aromaticivorans]
MFNTTAMFYKSMLLPLFKIGLVIFLIVFGVIAAVILWQKIRERQEYKTYLEQDNEQENVYIK